MAADAEEPPEHVADVASEQPAVQVQLVHDDDLDLLEELEPLGVVGKDRGVEHVRVGHHDLAGLTDRGADRRGRVAVIGRRGDRQAGRGGEGTECGDLVLAEGLRRKEPERPGRRVLGQRLEDRQLVAEALPGRGGRHDAHVASGAHRGERFRLVGVESGDALLRKSAPDSRIHPGRKWHRVRVPGRQEGMVDDAAGQGRLLEQPCKHGVGGSGRVRAHHCASVVFEQMSGMAAV
jgi:hypothetical protein